MYTIRRTTLVVLLLVLAALTAHGQAPVTVLPPGTTVVVSWDAPAVDATGANAPTGYRFETFRESATGVVVTTTNVPVTTTNNVELPITLLPDGAFLLAVRAYNASGVSERSNALPFVRPSAPGVPTGLRIAP